MLDINIYTVDAEIIEIVTQCRHYMGEPDCYIEVDSSSLARVEIPYLGEEDEIRDNVLIPAITNYLKTFGYLGRSEEVHFTGDSLYYTIESKSSGDLLYKIVLG